MKRYLLLFLSLANLLSVTDAQQLNTSSSNDMQGIRDRNPQPKPGDFDTASSQLFFNIFLFKPDPVVLPFIKKYFPNFLKRPDSGGWEIYPSPEPKPDQFYNTIHSMEFKKHPYFDAPFREGRLDILTQEKETGSGSIRGFQLWFFFDTKEEAEKGFMTLYDRFSTVCKNKRISKDYRRTISIYSDQADIESINRIVIILMQDDLDRKKYKIYITIGGFDVE
jgi:hypothetical protein